MRNLVKGGMVYNFDISTIGKISIEREYNKALYLDKDGATLITELNAFAHSLDFKSKNNVFIKSNSYIFLVKENVPNVSSYFADNLKKHLCGNLEFQDLLIDIYSDETFNLNFESIDTISYVKLTETLKKLTDFIIFEDYSGIEEKHTINNDNNIATQDFIRNVKLLYGENYNKAIKKGGVGSDDETLVEFDEYYSPIVSFNSYDTIKSYYSQHIAGEFFDNLAIIIGYTNMFRYSGLFGDRTNAYKSLNSLYHLLKYYPIYDEASVKNEYISHVYKETHFTLIELVKKLYNVCMGKNLNKSVVKSRSVKLSEYTSNIVETPVKKSTRSSKK